MDLGEAHGLETPKSVEAGGHGNQHMYAARRASNLICHVTWYEDCRLGRRFREPLADVLLEVSDHLERSSNLKILRIRRRAQHPLSASPQDPVSKKYRDRRRRRRRWRDRRRGFPSDDTRTRISEYIESKKVATVNVAGAAGRPDRAFVMSVF